MGRGGWQLGSAPKVDIGGKRAAVRVGACDENRIARLVMDHARQ
jgi:hypothetical protein